MDEAGRLRRTEDGGKWQEVRKLRHRSVAEAGKSCSLWH